jgi:hypothetical protein
MEIVRSNPEWCQRWATFESIELPSRTRWRTGYVDTSIGGYLRCPELILKIAWKAEDVQEWWDNKGECRDQTIKMLYALGLRYREPVSYRERNPLKGLKVGVCRKAQYIYDASRNGFNHWKMTGGRHGKRGL